MDFHLDCSCGNEIVVSEGSAGATVKCHCGRAIAVPGLQELRVRAGLSPYELAPEMAIEDLLTTGELPFGRQCAECDAETDALIHVEAECERRWTRSSGGSNWATILFGWIFLGIFGVLIQFWQRKDEREYGKDKVYLLPLRVCERCQPLLRGQEAIKQVMRKITDYRRLLDKFPEARVTVHLSDINEPTQGSPRI